MPWEPTPQRENPGRLGKTSGDRILSASSHLPPSGEGGHREFSLPATVREISSSQERAAGSRSLGPGRGQEGSPPRYCVGIGQQGLAPGALAGTVDPGHCSQPGC